MIAPLAAAEIRKARNYAGCDISRAGSTSAPARRFERNAFTVSVIPIRNAAHFRHFRSEGARMLACLLPRFILSLSVTHRRFTVTRTVMRVRTREDKKPAARTVNPSARMKKEKRIGRESDDAQVPGFLQRLSDRVKASLATAIWEKREESCRVIRVLIICSCISAVSAHCCSSHLRGDDEEGISLNAPVSLFPRAIGAIMPIPRREHSSPRFSRAFT
jgi:hypothetical protein